MSIKVTWYFVAGWSFESSIPTFIFLVISTIVRDFRVGKGVRGQVLRGGGEDLVGGKIKVIIVFVT